MTGAVLSGAIAAVDFDATKADVRRAVEDFLIILPRLRTPMLPAPRATLRLAAAIAGALLLPLPRGIDLGYAYQFLTMSPTWSPVWLKSAKSAARMPANAPPSTSSAWKGRGGRPRSFNQEAYRIWIGSERKPIGCASLSPRRAGKRASPRRRAARCRSAGCSH